MLRRLRAGIVGWLDAEDRQALGELAVKRGILALEMVGGATIIGISLAIIRTLGGF